jgi:ribonucrease Y
VGKSLAQEGQSDPAAAKTDMSVVWAIFFSALLGATFTAFLVWILTVRNRKLETERSKATLYYASKEAELAAREIRSKAEIEIEKRWTDLRREEDRVRIEAEARARELARMEESAHKQLTDLNERLERFEREALSLKQGRQSVSNLIRLYRRKISELGRITPEEAKLSLLQEVRQECQDEIRHYRKDLLERSEGEVQNEARKILITALQRASGRSHSDVTATMVSLPNEEMKGRIIGREGRNIKCFEAATGTTLLIDESPETLLISCFDPVRREIAKIALERLIEDGRIHPASIEEHITAAQTQIDTEVIRFGEEAVDRLKLSGVHHDILTLLGKLKYRHSLNQNVLEHSIEVAFLCSMLASEIGLDAVVAKRAGLFHDIGKAIDQEYEGSHALIGADILRTHGEPHHIINAVAAHHEEVPAESVYAGLLIAADTLSATRPGARTETQGNYLQRLEKLEKLALGLPGVLEAYAIQAGREIRVVVSPEETGDEDARRLARTLRQRIEDELQYPSVIKVTVIREQRFTETAK